MVPTRITVGLAVFAMVSACAFSSSSGSKKPSAGRAVECAGGVIGGAGTAVGGLLVGTLLYGLSDKINDKEDRRLAKTGSLLLAGALVVGGIGGMVSGCEGEEEEERPVIVVPQAPPPPTPPPVSVPPPVRHAPQTCMSSCAVFAQACPQLGHQCSVTCGSPRSHQALNGCLAQAAPTRQRVGREQWCTNVEICLIQADLPRSPSGAPGNR